MPHTASTFGLDNLQRLESMHGDRVLQNHHQHIARHMKRNRIPLHAPAPQPAHHVPTVSDRFHPDSSRPNEPNTIVHLRGKARTNRPRFPALSTICLSILT